MQSVNRAGVERLPFVRRDATVSVTQRRLFRHNAGGGESAHTPDSVRACLRPGETSTLEVRRPRELAVCGASRMHRTEITNLVARRASRVASARVHDRRLIADAGSTPL